MELIVWSALIGGVLFLIYYGYGLLVDRGSSEEIAAAADHARCHLCRREFPLGQMITREKVAGFENHFCGDCIEELYSDYTAHRDGRRMTRSMPGRN